MINIQIIENIQKFLVIVLAIFLSHTQKPQCYIQKTFNKKNSLNFGRMHIPGNSFIEQESLLHIFNHYHKQG